MDIKINPKPLRGSVEAIASKSHAHRLLLGAALCKTPCRIVISHMNEDLQATQNCISQLDNEVPVFHCGESGSTLRFLLPIAMALKEKAVFIGAGRLPDRPLSPLKEEMEEHGCRFSDVPPGDLTLSCDERQIAVVKGKLKHGRFKLSGNVSSQYVTGLLFALPLLEGDSCIDITSSLESAGYVALTLEVLGLFGIKVERVVSPEKGVAVRFLVKGGQTFVAPDELCAEGDWSNGAFWVAANVLSLFRCSEGKVSAAEDKAVICRNLRSESSQGDKAIIALAEDIIAHRFTSERLIWDASQIPDLVPVLSVLACGRQSGITEIVNAGRLRIKESDRLATVYEMLSRLGGNIRELEDGLIIEGCGSLKGGTVNGHNDHRIVMAAAVASILCTEPVTILGAEAMNKSYPDFLRDFSKLGGEYCEL